MSQISEEVCQRIRAQANDRCGYRLAKKSAGVITVIDW